MGYIQEVTITKDAVSCTGPSCSGFCSHSTWCLHKIFHFSKEEDFILKKNFNKSEWGQIIKAFPERVSLVRLPKCKEGFFVNVRQSQKDANCATSKHLFQSGDVQVSTEGPYRTIMRHWISRTFYFCPKLGCISKQPRNSFIQTYCPGATKLEFDKHLSPAQQVLHWQYMIVRYHLYFFWTDKKGLRIFFFLFCLGWLAKNVTKVLLPFCDIEFLVTCSYFLAQVACRLNRPLNIKGPSLNDLN